MNPGIDRGALDAKHRRSGVGRIGPATLVELQPCPKGEQIEQEEIETSLAAIPDSGLEVVARRRVAARDDCCLGEQHVCPRDLLGEPVSPRDLETLLEPHGAAGAQGGDAERGESVDGDLRLFETVRKLQRASGPAGRFLRPARGETV
jgi:hypothetical protein